MLPLRSAARCPAATSSTCTKIEVGVDKPGHAPARRLDDDAPGGSRLNVARANRGRRVDDHNRQPGVFRHVLDHSLGNDLALLVGADGQILGERTAFVGRRSGAQFDCGDAARIDDSLHAGMQGLLHDNPSPLHVCSQNFCRRGCPEPVIGRSVDHVADTANRRGDRIAVANIAHDDRISQVDVGCWA